MCWKAVCAKSATASASPLNWSRQRPVSTSWAERYDRDLADIFAVQDEITEAVTVAVAPAIAAAELHRAMRKPPEGLDAWAAYQRGLWHLEKATVNDDALAER